MNEIYHLLTKYLIGKLTKNWLIKKTCAKILLNELEFLGKTATFPQYVLILADLFSSKVYKFSVRSRKQISQSLELFYDQVESKRKGKEMKLQVDQEFLQQKMF